MNLSRFRVYVFPPLSYAFPAAWARIATPQGSAHYAKSLRNHARCKQFERACQLNTQTATLAIRRPFGQRLCIDFLQPIIDLPGFAKGLIEGGAPQNPLQ